MECHMLYVKSRKSFKVRRQKNLLLCRVPKKSTQQTMTLPCVTNKLTANHDFAVCFGFAVCFLEHTRQKSCLTCAREFAHGKLWCTRQNRSFR